MNKDSGKKYSKHGLSKSRAEAQMRALYSVIGKKGAGDVVWDANTYDTAVPDLPFQTSAIQGIPSQTLAGEQDLGALPTELPPGYTLARLQKTYSGFKGRQLQRFPTFQSYVDSIKRSDQQRVISNTIGDEDSKIAKSRAEANNEAYAKWIREHPGQERFFYHGRVDTRQNFDKANDEELDRRDPSRKAYRDIVSGLSKVADTGIQLLPVPWYVKNLYTNFAPPTSSYYKDNKIKAIEKLLD